MNVSARPSSPRAASGRGLWLPRACWAGCLLLVAATAVLWLSGDEWWLGTILCFGPRWVLAIPLLPLLLLGLAKPRRMLLPFGLSLVSLPFWFGVSIPWNAKAVPHSIPFRVITFNTQGTHRDLAGFVAWEAEQRPDLIVFQEADQQRLENSLGPGWHWSPSEGGVLLASRHPIVGVHPMHRQADADRLDCLCLDLEVEGTAVRIGGVHLPTPREGLEALVHWNPRFMGIMAAERTRRDLISKEASDFLLTDQRVDVLAGDFNMPVESRIFRRHWGRLTNAFSAAGWGLGYTKFTRWHGVRIDHILVANPNVGVARSFVGPDVGSDHRPIFAELALPSRRTVH